MAAAKLRFLTYSRTLQRTVPADTVAFRMIAAREFVVSRKAYCIH